MIDQLLLVALFIVVGYILLALELLVIPGFGVAGFGGLACLVTGSVLAVRYFGGTTGGLVVVGVLAVATVLMIGLPRTRHGRNIVHRQSLAGATASRSQAAVGDAGVAESDLRPAGIARFGEQRESVVTDGEYIAAGTPVRVTQVEGGRVVVENTREAADAPPSPDTADDRRGTGTPREGDA
jgi:membrane-bound serine protease (ClpP class)